MKQQIATSNGYVYQNAHNNITVNDVIMKIMTNIMFVLNPDLKISSPEKYEVIQFFGNTLGGLSLPI